MGQPLSRRWQRSLQQAGLLVGMVGLLGCGSQGQDDDQWPRNKAVFPPIERAPGTPEDGWHTSYGMLRKGVPLSRSRIEARWDARTETWRVFTITVLSAERCEAEAVLDADMSLISYRMTAESATTGASVWNVWCTRNASVLLFINRTASGSVKMVPVRSQEQIYPSTLIYLVLAARSKAFPGQDRFTIQILYEKTLEIIAAEYTRSELKDGDRRIVQFRGVLKGMEIFHYYDVNGAFLGSRMGDLMLVSRTAQHTGFDPPLQRAMVAEHQQEHAGQPPGPISSACELGYSDVRLVGDVPVEAVSDDRQLLLLAPTKEGSKWKTEVRVLETSAWPGAVPSAADVRATAHIQSDADGIRQQAMAITRDTADRLSSAMRLLEWCHRSLRYSDGSPVDANSVFRSRIAECQGASNLMVAMCRSIGIPSRPVAGVMLPTAVGEAASPQFHQWAEIYDGRLWHGLDPVPGSPVTSRHLKLVEIQDPSDLWTIYPHLDTLSVEVVRSE